MSEILFKNLALLDVTRGRLVSGHQILVRDNKISQIAKGSIRAPKAQVVDCGGRTLMPGLIDCHVHLVFVANHAGILGRSGMDATPAMLPSLMNAYVSELMRGMVLRGFTTVRDAGGADLGHKQAIERKLFLGPRLFVSGRAISQTGGHGDGRARADLMEPCSCVHLAGGIGRLADGDAEVRKAVRDEIRLGADQIKLMAGGGVGSLHDPIDQLQYSTAELEAVVDEATRSHTYVLAHAYTADAIRRCVAAGVRTIEHGNLIDEDAARKMARARTYLVPTLVTYDVGMKIGREMRMPEETMAKRAYVYAAGTKSLELAKRAGVKIAFGTDLYIKPDQYQSDEFKIRAEVLSTAEVIRSATTIGAEVVRMPGQIGIIKEGALADLLVVDGNPLDDIKVLCGQGEKFSVIMKDGEFVKNRLPA